MEISVGNGAPAPPGIMMNRKDDSETLNDEANLVENRAKTLLLVLSRLRNLLYRHLSFTDLKERRKARKAAIALSNTLGEEEEEEEGVDLEAEQVPRRKNSAIDLNASSRTDTTLAA